MKRLLVPFLTSISLAIASPTLSEVIPEVEAADTNNNGFLNLAEIDRLISALEAIEDSGLRDNDPSLIRAGNVIQAVELAQDEHLPGAPVPIDKIIFRTELENRCNLRERAILVRESLRDDPPELCDQAGQNGLTIPFNQDQVAGASEFTLKGGIGYAFLLPSRVEGASTAMLYLDADGTFASDGDGSGTVYAGLNARTIVDVSSFGILDITGGLYALTDPNFDAYGYGARLSVLPVSPRYALNIRPLGRNLHWTLQGDIDTFYVEEAGTTGFESNTEKMVGTIDVGLLYDIDESEVFKFGAQLSATGTYAYDFKDDESFEHVEFKFTRYMDAEQTVGLQLLHERGRTIDAEDFVEQTSVQWTFAF